ncbi:outer membrane beta-barrel protein [Helicobacter cetorum]|uniref:outer membrane beta-barrel protein n=1 Tax=Helicobacter cetorum TaxID=138563 RepID=UPI000CF0E953|nr:outer membrane beta-barrel protein [Helicobacter cetorum]
MKKLSFLLPLSGRNMLVGVVSLCLSQTLYAEEDGWYASAGYQIGESEQQVKGTQKLVAPTIKALEERIKATQVPMGAVQEQIKALDNQISAKQNEINEKNKNIQALQSKINDYQNTIDSKQQEIATQQANIDNIKNQIKDINTQIENQKAQIARQEAQIKNQEAEISTQKAKIETQKSTIATQTTEQQAQQQKLDALNNKISGLQSQISQKEQEIAKNQQAIDGLNTQLDTLKQQAQTTQTELIQATAEIFKNVAPQFFGQGQSSIQNAASATLTMAQNLIGFLGNNGNSTGWAGMGQVGSSISITKGIDILRKSDVVIPGSTGKNGPFAGYEVTTKNGQNIISIGNQSIAMPEFQICTSAGHCQIDKTNATSTHLNTSSTLLDTVVAALQYQAAYAPTYGSMKWEGEGKDKKLVKYDYVTSSALNAPNGFSTQGATFANGMTEEKLKTELPKLINQVGYDAQTALNSIKGGVEMLNFMMEVAKAGGMSESQIQSILFGGGSQTEQQTAQIEQELQSYITKGLEALAKETTTKGQNKLLELAQQMVTTQSQINADNSKIAKNLNDIIANATGTNNPFNVPKNTAFKPVTTYTDKLTGTSYDNFVNATNSTKTKLESLKEQIAKIDSQQTKLEGEQTTQTQAQAKVVQAKNELDSQLTTQQAEQSKLSQQTQALNNSIQKLNEDNQNLETSNQHLASQNTALGAQNKQLAQQNQELANKTTTLQGNEQTQQASIQKLQEAVGAQNKLQAQTTQEQDAVKQAKAEVVSVQNELKATKNALINKEKQIYQASAKDRQAISFLQKASRSNSMTNNGAMNGLGFNMGYKQFFGKKHNIGLRYYGFMDYNHTYIKSDLLSSASDVFTYGVGSDFLYNFINNKSIGSLCKNSKKCPKLNIGTLTGIQIAGTTWLSNVNNALSSYGITKPNFSHSNFQFLFNLGFRLNMEVSKKQSHGFEVGVKIPTLNTNYYSKDNVSITLRRLYSVFINYTYGF